MFGVLLLMPPSLILTDFPYNYCLVQVTCRGRIVPKMPMPEFLEVVNMPGYREKRN